MKNIFYCAAIFFILAGCNPDSDPKSVDPAPITFPELHLTNVIKNMVPLDHLTNGAKVVFVNQFGDERTYIISLETGIKRVQKIYTWSDHTDSLDYQAEYLNLSYIDSTFLTLTPYIFLTANYGIEGNTFEVLTAGLGSVGGSYLPIISIDATGRLRFGDVVGDYDLNGHQYQNIYTSMDHQPGPANFSRLYYNMEKGIVAFEGMNGLMWALDRFEN